MKVRMPYVLEIVEMLETAELARLQLVDVATRRAGERAVWMRSAARWSEWTAPPALYEPFQRRYLLGCLSLLKNTVLEKNTPSSRLCLQTSFQAQKLMLALQHAWSVSASHKAMGGAVARVLVGYFRPSTLTVEGQEKGGSIFCAGSSASPFALGTAGPGGRNGELRLSLGMKPDGAISISATHSRWAALKRVGGGHLRPATIIVDVTAASPDMQLSVRNAMIKVDGHYESSRTGSWSTASSQAESGQSISMPEDILCVMCIRERHIVEL
mmetsp:Transcript_3929/g.9138  ORF Transcript_3929/g.9138 Transcript_3929/m.9138 type:complete len:270 (+) Transcript_3929:3-812(+)